VVLKPIRPLKRDHKPDDHASPVYCRSVIGSAHPKGEGRRAGAGGLLSRPTTPEHLCEVEEHRSSLILLSSCPEARTEHRAGIPSAHAQALLAVTAGRVNYVRTSLSIGSREFQLQHLVEPGALDLISVEVEQDDQAFQPLSWFGPEVSAERAYQRQRMALDSLPAHLRSKSGARPSTASLMFWRTSSHPGRCRAKPMSQKSRPLINPCLRGSQSQFLRSTWIRTMMIPVLRMMSSGSWPVRCDRRGVKHQAVSNFGVGTAAPVRRNIHSGSIMSIIGLSKSLLHKNYSMAKFHNLCSQNARV
jgi:CYTH domain-containing protein